MLGSRPVTVKTDMKSHQRLKILRLLNGYTQASFARIANIPQQSLGCIETGRYAPSGATGITIAAALGVPFEYLYEVAAVVDSNGGMVWHSAPPSRSQHVQSMCNDIKSLFPPFLTENGFTDVIAARLQGGGSAFLLGRATGAGKPVTVSCLLLADQRICSCIQTAVSRADGVTLHEVKALPCSITSFGAKHFETINSLFSIDYSMLEHSPRLSATSIPECGAEPASADSSGGNQFGLFREWLFSIEYQGAEDTKSAITDFIRQNIHFNEWLNIRTG